MQRIVSSDSGPRLSGRDSPLEMQRRRAHPSRASVRLGARNAIQCVSKKKKKKCGRCDTMVVGLFLPLSNNDININEINQDVQRKARRLNEADTT